MGTDINLLIQTLKFSEMIEHPWRTNAGQLKRNIKKVSTTDLTVEALLHSMYVLCCEGYMSITVYNKGDEILKQFKDNEMRQKTEKIIADVGLPQTLEAWEKVASVIRLAN